ncbi:MAG: class I tRNA ligase family protein, partial [Betaproteobacteria bacterium]
EVGLPASSGGNAVITPASGDLSLTGQAPTVRITYFNPADVEVKNDEDGNRISILKADGAPVEYAGIGTMSKSKNNGVDPQELIDHYGADVARFFMMFTAPPEQTLEWSEAGVQGAYRFFNRLWTFVFEHKSEISVGLTHQKPFTIDWSKVPKEHSSWRKEIHALLKQANYDMSRFQFNTVASACNKILNTLDRAPGAMKADVRYDALHASVSVTATLAEGVSILLRLLSPISPHITHYLWRELKYGEDILAAPWPEPDAAALIEDEIDLVVQVNGKRRADARVPREADNATIEKIVLSHPNVQKFVAGQVIKRVIVVPGRLVNVVI